jgi:hypothetical protein
MDIPKIKNKLLVLSLSELADVKNAVIHANATINLVVKLNKLNPKY